MSDSREPEGTSAGDPQTSAPRINRRRLRLVTTVAIASAAILFVVLLVPAVFQARDAARRQASKNGLKHIGFALRDYHANWQLLPPGGIFNARETPFFGWPVSILPYVDASPIYNMVNFSVPWNDPANADIFRRPYPWYLSASVAETTDSQGFVLTHYVANQNVLFRNSSVSIADITDGLNQTILAGEIADGFLPYAQPGNWRDPATGINAGPKSFGRPSRDGAFMLMADGAVFFLPNSIDPKVLRALSTPAGGEDVESEWP